MAFCPYDARYNYQNCCNDSFFVGLLIWGAFFTPNLPGNQELQWFKDVGLGILLVATSLALLIWSNKTYQISYDDDAVYMGSMPWHWSKLRFVKTETTMRYDEIAELGAGQGEGILPFAYIAFLREGGGWKENGEWEEKFFVSRYQLRDDDVRQFIDHLHTKIPDKFPLEVLEYMQNHELRGQVR